MTSSAPHLQGLESVSVTPVSRAKGFQIKPKEDVMMAETMKSRHIVGKSTGKSVALTPCSFCGFA